MKGHANLLGSSLYADNEALIGKWLKRTGKRDDVFLATKFGMTYNAKTGELKIDSSAGNCKACCEKSLKALGVDCIDLCKLKR